MEKWWIIFLVASNCSCWKIIKINSVKSYFHLTCWCFTMKKVCFAFCSLPSSLLLSLKWIILLFFLSEKFTNNINKLTKWNLNKHKEKKIPIFSISIFLRLIFFSDFDCNELLLGVSFLVALSLVGIFYLLQWQFKIFFTMYFSELRTWTTPLALMCQWRFLKFIWKLTLMLFLVFVLEFCFSFVIYCLRLDFF